MDMAGIKVKIADMVKKYKYAAIILAVGIVLMLVPVGRQEKAVSESNVQQIEKEENMNTSLEKILSQIAGAGEVRVLLTLASGEETIYQTDNKLTQSEDNSSTQIDTITITDSDRNETGLVKQRISPVYRGAIVVCEGADSAKVRLAIVEAVAKVTGLSSDRISVLKMK